MSKQPVNVAKSAVHTCYVHSMKKVGGSNTSVQLRCTGCGSTQNVEKTSRLYTLWQALQRQKRDTKPAPTRMERKR